MYVCMYVYIYIHTYVCMYICIYVSQCAWLCIVDLCLHASLPFLSFPRPHKPRCQYRCIHTYTISLSLAVLFFSLDVYTVESMHWFVCLCVPIHMCVCVCVLWHAYVSCMCVCLYKSHDTHQTAGIQPQHSTLQTPKQHEQTTNPSNTNKLPATRTNYRYIGPSADRKVCVGAVWVWVWVWVWAARLAMNGKIEP